MRARIGIVLVGLLCVIIPARAASAAAMRPYEQVTTSSTPPSTAPSTLAPTSTAATTVAPTTTSQATSTTSTTQPTTTTSTTTPTTTTTAAKSSSGTSGGTIALIVALIVAALLIIALILLLLRRRGRAQWREQARGASAEGASLLALLMAGLAALDEPARAARTWSDFEARGAHLHGRLQALGTAARDEHNGAAVNGVDRDLQSLRSAVEADRGLRLGPPPPTTEQLGYSEAVIRQRTADFEQSLGDLDRYLAEPT